MNGIRLFLIPLLSFAASGVCAQVTIDRVKPRKGSVDFNDQIKTQQVDLEAFSLAKYRAERAAIRHERNYLEVTSSLNGTLTAYNDPWIETSGGDNSIAALGAFYLKHIFKKEKFSIETVVDAKFGYNRIRIDVDDADGNSNKRGVWFKNQDYFYIQTKPSFRMAKNWSYGPSLTLRSQFAGGYQSRSEQESIHRKSGFMSPGTFEVSGNLTYTSPLKRFPLTVTFSPISLTATYVLSHQIRENFDYQFREHIEANYKPTAAHGVPSGKSAKYEGGSSMQLDFDRTFGKRGVVRYRTMYYMNYNWITRLHQKNKVYGYHDYLAAVQTWQDEGGNADTRPSLPLHPTLRWTNTIDIKATKLLTTTITYELSYDRAQNLECRTKTGLIVGISYTFKNKPKP